MKSSIPLTFLFLILMAAPAPAQNLWPVSFGYWCNYPDRYMPDLRAADHSMTHADQMAGLDDHQLRTLMQSRSQAMSRHELESYHTPNMLAPIYPSEEKPETESPKLPADVGSPAAPAVAPPPRTPAPFPTPPPADAASTPAQPLPKP